MSKIMRKIFTITHQSYGFYALLFGTIGGIALGHLTQNVWVENWLVIIVLIIIAMYLIMRVRVILVLPIFMIGVILGNYRFLPELSDREVWQELVNTQVRISGKISDDPSAAQGTYKVKLSHIKLQHGEEKPEIGGTAYAQIVSKDVALERGDEITINGKVGAGFGTYLANFYRPTLEKIQRAEHGDIFVRIKNWFAGRVREFLPASEAELGLGYLMGLKNLPKDLSDTLRIVGMTHVVVASGTHLGILVGAARKIFGKISKFAGLLGAFLLIAAFVMIVGFTPSMTRAALVSGLSMAVGYFGRKFTPFRLLGLVAALTLLLSPDNLINLGWQLSFASFAGILILAPKMQKLLYGGKKPPWLANMFITSFSTTLICLPILIYNFGTISLLSFVANLIILPTLPYAMLLIFLVGVCSFIPWCASMIAQIAKLLLDLHINLVQFLSAQKAFIFELEPNHVSIFLIYLPIIIFIVWVLWITRQRSRHNRADYIQKRPCLDTS